MARYAKDGVCLATLVQMAIPVCQQAEREHPRTGRGRRPEIPDWVMAVLIMVSVLKKRKSKRAQYRFLEQHKSDLLKWMGTDRFPARSTYCDRYRRAHELFRHVILLQAEKEVQQGRIDAATVAIATATRSCHRGFHFSRASGGRDAGGADAGTQAGDDRGSDDAGHDPRVDGAGRGGVGRRTLRGDRGRGPLRFRRPTSRPRRTPSRSCRTACETRTRSTRASRGRPGARALSRTRVQRERSDCRRTTWDRLARPPPDQKETVMITAATGPAFGKERSW